MFAKFLCLFLAVLSLAGLGIVSGASVASNMPSGILTYVETEVNEPGLDSPRLGDKGLALYMQGHRFWIAALDIQATSLNTALRGQRSEKNDDTRVHSYTIGLYAARYREGEPLWDFGLWLAAYLLSPQPYRTYRPLT